MTGWLLKRVVFFEKTCEISCERIIDHSVALSRKTKPNKLSQRAGQMSLAGFVTVRSSQLICLNYSPLVEYDKTSTAPGNLAPSLLLMSSRPWARAHPKCVHIGPVAPYNSSHCPAWSNDRPVPSPPLRGWEWVSRNSTDHRPDPHPAYMESPSDHWQ